MFIEALSKLKKNHSDKEFLAVILGSEQGRNVYKKKLLRLVDQHRLVNDVLFVDNLLLIGVGRTIGVNSGYFNLNLFDI